jgi:phage tail sheath gpL-like
VANVQVPTNVLISLQTVKDPGSLSFADWGKTRVMNEVENLLASLALGIHPGAIDVQKAPSYAYGVLLIASGSGAVGGTIGGKLVTATWATSDANSADLVAAAILADTTANTYVSAASRAATGTITMATSSGVITAIINGVSVSVTWATSDTATATALAAAINATVGLPVIAYSAAGVVTVVSTLAGSGATNTAGNSIPLDATGTNVTKSGVVLSNGGTVANVLIKALAPGTVGNGITLALSGTGVTAPSGARFVGGLGAPGNAVTR